MIIELSGEQFWSEIILMISNRTSAQRSFDFEITRVISDLIIYMKKFLHSDWLRGMQFSVNTMQNICNSVLKEVTNQAF